jgi:hypothetical protein
MSKVELAVIERDRIVRRGVLVDVVGTKKAPGTDGSLVLLKKCKHAPRIATKRSKIPCMQCRPAWVREMGEKERTALSRRAADVRRRYGKSK